MTGRDYKQFIKIHREGLEQSTNDENLKFLSKLADKNLTKYKQVNYDLVKDFIGERKEAAKTSLTKVKKLEECSKEKKQLVFSKQHKYVWLKEMYKLNATARKCEEELYDYLKTLQINSVEYANINSDDDFDEEDIEFFYEHVHIDEIEKYKKKLDYDLSMFKKYSLEPIQNLNEDLKYYLSVSSQKAIKTNHEKNNEILDTIDQVKQQQSNLLEQMEVECMTYFEEINIINNEFQKEELSVDEGIPDAAYYLLSPDDDLKSSVLNEFLIIDQKYKEKEKQLRENYKSILESEEYDGWDQFDHELFQHIYEQYYYHNPSLTNCNFTLRDLLFDRVKRVFESYGKSIQRPEMVKHEEWMTINRFYQQQRKLIYTEWNEARKALLIKAEAVFHEAYEMIEIEREKKNEREKQLKICKELYSKVQKFREQKLEALEIQQKLDKMIEDERKQKLKFELEREKKRRDKQKQDIMEYHSKLDEEKQQIEAMEREKLEEIKINLSKQAEIDEKRIEYRKKEYDEKKKKYEQKKLEEKKEREMKEKRIEALIQSVKPNVEADPARMVSFTMSELHRRGVNTTKDQDAGPEDKYHDRKDMYNVYTYTDKQLKNDARMKLEEQLRYRGLINNDYAREIIKNVKPPTIPRRDNISNSNWNGFALDSNNNQ